MENTDDKYYTPEMSEFHIGFEYEFLERHGSPDERWVKKTLTRVGWDDEDGDSAYLGNSFRAIEKYDDVFIRVAIRVRKLSRECIEELGWVYDDKDTFTIIPSSCDLIYTESLYRWIVILDDGGNTIYNGLCRNKSHLRQLMKDLGISK